MRTLTQKWTQHCRFLIIDNDRATHRLMAHFLKELGADVTTASDPNSAIETALRSVESSGVSFDFILLTEDPLLWNNADPRRIFGMLNPTPVLIFGVESQTVPLEQRQADDIESYHIRFCPRSMKDFLRILASHGFLSDEADSFYPRLSKSVTSQEMARSARD